MASSKKTGKSKMEDGEWRMALGLPLCHSPSSILHSRLRFSSAASPAHSAPSDSAEAETGNTSPLHRSPLLPQPRSESAGPQRPSPRARSASPPPAPPKHPDAAAPTDAARTAPTSARTNYHSASAGADRTGSA